MDQNALRRRRCCPPTQEPCHASRRPAGKFAPKAEHLTPGSSAAAGQFDTNLADTALTGCFTDPGEILPAVIPMRSEPI